MKTLIAKERELAFRERRQELADKEGSPYYDTAAARTVAFKNGWDACLETLGEFNPNMSAITAIRKQVHEEHEATIKTKTETLIERFRHEIATSDFHLPEFISGVPMADGSDEYKKAYGDEERRLAEQCAKAHVQQTLITLNKINDELNSIYESNIDPIIQEYMEINDELDELDKLDTYDR